LPLESTVQISIQLSIYLDDCYADGVPIAFRFAIENPFRLPFIGIDNFDRVVGVVPLADVEGNTKNENCDTEQPIKKFHEFAELSHRVLRSRRFGVLPRENGDEVVSEPRRSKIQLRRKKARASIHKGGRNRRRRAEREGAKKLLGTTELIGVTAV